MLLYSESHDLGDEIIVLEPYSYKLFNAAIRGQPTCTRWWSCISSDGDRINTPLLSALNPHVKPGDLFLHTPGADASAIWIALSKGSEENEQLEWKECEPGMPHPFLKGYVLSFSRGRLRWVTRKTYSTYRTRHA
jgi:hypothetical protein